MPKHSILERQLSSQRLPRNAFDLSYRRLFTGDVGELLPIYCEHVNPNEHFRINPQVFLRAQTLNTSAFTRMKQNVDFFFVPARLLSRYLPQQLVGANFFPSSQYGNGNIVADKIPLVYVGSHIYNDSSFQCYYPVNCLMSGGSESYNPIGNDETDLFGFNYRMKSARLMQLLGYGGDPYNSPAITGDSDLASARSSNVGVSALPIFAYHRIYNDMYRNPYLESYNPVVSNFDSFYSNSGDSGLKDYYLDTYYCNLQTMYQNGFLELHYKNYKMDYFTHCNPSFRGVDFISSSPDAITFPTGLQYAGSSNGLPYSGYSSSINTSSSKNQGLVSGRIGTDGKSSMFQVFSIANLRSAYALDKLLSISSNAKDGSYNEQIKAHFGFDPSLDDDKVRFIGSVDAPVTISDVEATATTDSSTLAQIAGKGVSLSNGAFEFDTKEHGIIMGIFYILPECDYGDYGVDPFNVKTRPSEFFHPEFDRLGQQPITLKELQSFQLNSDLPSVVLNNIFGYTNRYAEYKARFDKVDGEFLGDLNSWVTPRSLASSDVSYVSTGLNKLFIKCNPASMNNIFAVQADGTHNQFMCVANFGVQAVRPMSIYGDPYSTI